MQDWVPIHVKEPDPVGFGEEGHEGKRGYEEEFLRRYRRDQ